MRLQVPFEGERLFVIAEGEGGFNLPRTKARCMTDLAGVVRLKAFLQVPGITDVMAAGVGLACEDVDVVKTSSRLFRD